MVEGTDRAGDFIEACIDRPDEAQRMAAADPSVLYLECIGTPRRCFICCVVRPPNSA